MYRRWDVYAGPLASTTTADVEEVVGKAAAAIKGTKGVRYGGAWCLCWCLVSRVLADCRPCHVAWTAIHHAVVPWGREQAWGCTGTLYCTTVPHHCTVPHPTLFPLPCCDFARSDIGTELPTFCVVGSYDGKAVGPAPASLALNEKKTQTKEAAAAAAAAEEEHEESDVAMASLDIFAGCGGLSEGMHQVRRAAVVHEYGKGEGVAAVDFNVLWAHWAAPAISRSCTGTCT